MTPSPTARVTRWIVVENANFMGHRVQREDGHLLFLGSSTFEDCTLIATALNAVVSLNPSDPLSAAQHLEELVGAAKRVNVYFDVRGETRISGLQALYAAVSRVTGKP